MKIEKSFELKSARDLVWQKFSDVHFVAECLPGASIVGELGDNRYKGRMSVKVGPMAAAFNGEIGIENKPEQWTGVVSGKGADSGSSSRASGTMTYSLADGAAPGSTRVDIVSDINLAGSLAQFSKGAIVQEIANRITASFVANFERRLAASSTAVSEGSTQSAPPPQRKSLDAGGLLWSVLRARILRIFQKLVRPLVGRIMPEPFHTVRTIKGRDMMLRKSLPIGLLGVTLAVAGAHAQDTVKIGVIQPLTGSVAFNGTTDVNGIKLALDEVNKKGGVLGKKVELVIEDGQCKPASSVNAAEKLIQRDHVVGIIGAFCSSATAAVMPVAKSNKIPLVTGVSSAANLTEKDNPWFFRATETDELLAKSFAKILVNQLKLKKVAYIGVNDDFGRGSVESFSKQMEALGAKTVMKEYFEHGTSDFYTLLTKLKASGADGAFVSAETQDGATFIKQKAELGLKSKVFGVGSWATSTFMKFRRPGRQRHLRCRALRFHHGYAEEPGVREGV